MRTCRKNKYNKSSEIQCSDIVRVHMPSDIIYGLVTTVGITSLLIRHFESEYDLNMWLTHKWKPFSTTIVPIDACTIVDSSEVVFE